MTRYALLIAFLLLTSCGVVRRVITVHYVTSGSYLIGPGGERCEVGSYIYDEEENLLTEIYKTCKVELKRILEEREVKQWTVKKRPIK